MSNKEKEAIIEAMVEALEQGLEIDGSKFSKENRLYAHWWLIRSGNRN